MICSCDKDEISPVKPIPSTPTDLTATPLTDSMVQLVWIDACSFESGFQIGRNVEVDEDWDIIALLVSNTETYTDTGLSEGTQYNYRITAFDSELFSESSDIVSVVTRPSAPYDLTTTAISGTTVDIVWQDNSEVETGFDIQRRRGINGDFESIVELPENITAFHDTSLIANSRYFYRVRALYDTLGSLWSNEASAPTIQAPSGLISKALSDSAIWLGWRDNSYEETAFYIEREHAESDGWQLLTILNRNIEAYTDLDVHEGRFYRHRVHAMYGDAPSPPSETVETLTPPRAPVSLVAYQDQHADTVIRLSWIDQSDIETAYNLQRRVQYSGDFITIVSLPSNSELFADVGLQPNQVYIYRVRAMQDTNSSNWSNEASAATTVLTPQQPTDLVTDALNPFQVRLIWSDNSNNEHGFVVERSRSLEEVWVFLDSLDENATRHYDTGLSSQTTYYYRVKAWNEHGDSPYSNIAEITTPQEVPEAPSNLQVVEVTYEMVTLEWQDNSDDELGFRIARRLLPWSCWDPTGEVNTNITIFTDTTVEYRREYGYQVSAFNEAGESGWCQEVIVEVPEGPPGTPEHLHAQALDWDVVHLTWTRTSENETGFRIERRLQAEENYSQIGETNRAEVAYQDRGLDPESWYWYRIQAYNEVDVSDYSNIDSVQTPICAVFQDDFEDYQAGSPPVGNGWTSERQGTSFVAVTSQDAHGGNQSVLFNDAEGADSSYCMLHLNHEPVEAGNIDCWLKIAPDGYFGLSGDDSRDYITFRIEFCSNNTVFFQNGYDSVQYNGGYPVDEWFRLRITFDTYSHLYSISFNGEPIVENLNLQRADHQANTQLRFSTYVETAIDYVYLDDVIIREVDGAVSVDRVPKNEKILNEGVKKLSDNELYLP